MKMIEKFQPKYMACSLFSSPSNNLVQTFLSSLFFYDLLMDKVVGGGQGYRRLFCVQRKEEKVTAVSIILSGSG